MKDVIATNMRLYGPQSPALLQVKIPLAELLVHEGRFREANELTTEVYPSFVKVFGDSNDFTLQVLAIRALSESSLEQWDAAVQDEATIHVMATKADPNGGFATVAYSDLGLYLCQAGRYSQGTPIALSSYEQTKKVFAGSRDFIDSTAFALAFCDIGTGKTNEAASLLGNIDANSVAQVARRSIVRRQSCHGQGPGRSRPRQTRRSGQTALHGPTSVQADSSHIVSEALVGQRSEWSGKNQVGRMVAGDYSKNRGVAEPFCTKRGTRLPEDPRPRGGGGT